MILKSIIVSISAFTCIKASALEVIPLSIVEERGFFSLGLIVGAAKTGLQNTNGNYSGYQTTNFGADLELKIFGSGAGQIGIFGSYIYGDGKNSSNQNDKIVSQETALGLKIGLSPNFYLSGAATNNKLSLSSSSSSNTLSISHNMTKVALGIELPMSEEFLFGFEVNYRTGPVKKSDNPDLTNNTYYEGSSALIKLIWSPPSVTNNFGGKKSFR